MLKMAVISCFMMLLVFLAYISDFFAIMALSATKWIAFGILVIMLIIARLVLGSPFAKGQKNEKDDE